MSDVFISYARASEEQAKQVELALRHAGYSVWRDIELPAHRTYAEVIEERLKAAKAVVALWSAEAIKSQWVRSEADAARELGTLIQASLDGTIPPLPFNQIQCAELRGWSGDADARGWRKLVASVAALAGPGNEPTKTDDSHSRHRERAVCVLPFANMSGDAEQEYFSDGISEDITTDLSKVSALAVTARNTAFMFKGSAVDVCEVARKLSVSHVLEGSVRKAGNRVRITAQLIDGKSGDHVWAERFDRDLTDIFAIQDEISKAIVSALKLKLLPQEKKAIEQRGTTNAEAYNLYLMARQYWATGNHGDRRREERVIRICQRAVEIDPDYARAWALMAIAQSHLRYGFDEISSDDGVAAAERALELDPTIAEAHCPKARYFAERACFDDADREIRKALSLDAESWEVNKEAGRIFYGQHRIEEAAGCFQRAAQAMETDFHAWGLLFSCERALGREEKLPQTATMVLKQVERVVAQDPDNAAALSLGASALAVLGQTERAEEWLQKAFLVNPENLTMQYNFACHLAGHLNDHDRAIALLEPVFGSGGKALVNLAGTDPDMETLRGDPRFQKMLAGAKERLGITEAAPATPARTQA